LQSVPIFNIGGDDALFTGHTVEKKIRVVDTRSGYVEDTEFGSAVGYGLLAPA
jgi:hypothetical protein